ncbi:RluA family pseudouridine synthase [Candidatus Saccharibacteria bacterium]|nr:RluA family pseudouridine synthase [Candidatus Saccharibacteria bacterium]
MIQVTVPKTSAGERLDVFVHNKLPQISRAHVQKLCNRGFITVGDEIKKTGYKLRLEDQINIDFDPNTTEDIPRIELPVLYEDDDCVVINKPAGLLTHSKGAFNPEATIATWLFDHLNKHARQQNTSLLDLRKIPRSQGESARAKTVLSEGEVPEGTSREEKLFVAEVSRSGDEGALGKSSLSDSQKSSMQTREGIVHRLDRATSGVIICAKNNTSLSWLQKQFSTRKVYKTYKAVVFGHIIPAHAIIDMPIERNPKHPQTFRTGINGKTAQTEYNVVKSGKNYDLVELKPRTEHTHQLRVHLKKLGYPIVGDTIYDGQSADRLYLHAEKLELTLKNGKHMTFQVPVPEEFFNLLDS